MALKPIREGLSVLDDDLLARAHSLEADALAEIHTRYYHAILGFIAFRVSDQETAEDLTSEVFVRLLDALHSGKGPRDSLKNWLYGVASHVVSDFYRKHYRARQVDLSDTLADSDAPNPEESLERLLTHENLADLIAELTAEQQMALTLRFSQNQSIEETARLMGKSEGSVKMLQARALARLAARLSRQEQ